MAGAIRLSSSKFFQEKSINKHSISSQKQNVVQSKSYSYAGIITALKNQELIV
jgi:hypothetical protein